MSLVDDMSEYEAAKWRLSGPHHEEPHLLGDCVHCGERVWGHDDPGECAHGIAHGQCMADNGCKIA